MEKPKFKVIKGGIPDDAESPGNIAQGASGISPGSAGNDTDSGRSNDGKIFDHAWVTDTRLVNVISMCMVWRIPGKNDKGEYEELMLHQFFYFDAVETGFERFQEVFGNNENDLNAVEASFAGGLGGKKIDISKDEAVHLFKKYYSMNRKLDLELPPNGNEYAFLLLEPDRLSEAEEKALFKRTCKHGLAYFEIINYFMMEIANSDEECIRYLTAGRYGKELSPDKRCYTLYKNDITLTGESPKVSPEKEQSCTCESVLESDDGYEIWKSSIKVENGAVTSYKRTSVLHISDTEAYLSLAHSEFIMVYSFSTEAVLPQDATPLTKRATMIDEEDGYSYMLFRPDNNHVNTAKYRLFDDMFGLYHMTSKGQLVCSANTQHDMGMLELDLVFSPLYSQMEIIGNYEFNEPVMAQFLSSGYDDFNDFMREITDLD